MSNPQKQQLRDHPWVLQTKGYAGEEQLGEALSIALHWTPVISLTPSLDIFADQGLCWGGAAGEGIIHCLALDSSHLPDPFLGIFADQGLCWGGAAGGGIIHCLALDSSHLPDPFLGYFCRPRAMLGWSSWGRLSRAATWCSSLRVFPGARDDEAGSLQHQRRHRQGPHGGHRRALPPGAVCGPWTRVCSTDTVRVALP